LSSFSPRKWVLENMTDQISAQLLLSIVDPPYPGLSNHATASCGT
jgi:hypothetical protein